MWEGGRLASGHLYACAAYFASGLAARSLVTHPASAAATVHLGGFSDAGASRHSNWPRILRLPCPEADAETSTCPCGSGRESGGRVWRLASTLLATLMAASSVAWEHVRRSGRALGSGFAYGEGVGRRWGVDDGAGGGEGGGGLVMRCSLARGGAYGRV